MSHSLPLERASSELRGLVHSMKPGDEIVLTENQKPIARIVSDRLSHSPAMKHDLGSWKGKLQILDDGDEVIRDHFKDYLA